MASVAAATSVAANSERNVALSEAIPRSTTRRDRYFRPGSTRHKNGLEPTPEPPRANPGLDAAQEPPRANPGLDAAQEPPRANPGLDAAQEPPRANRLEGRWPPAARTVRRTMASRGTKPARGIETGALPSKDSPAAT